MKNGSCSATALPGSTALPFVIPTEEEGPAVQRSLPGNVFDRAATHAEGKMAKLIN
jgi:hypothetical protein